MLSMEPLFQYILQQGKCVFAYLFLITFIESKYSITSEKKIENVTNMV